MDIIKDFRRKILSEANQGNRNFLGTRIYFMVIVIPAQILDIWPSTAKHMKIPISSPKQYLQKETMLSLSCLRLSSSNVIKLDIWLMIVIYLGFLNKLKP